MMYLRAFIVLLAFAVPVMAQRAFTKVDVPGALQTGVSGIWETSLVGSFQDGSGYHGFVKSGGTYTTLDAPWAPVLDTFARGTDGARVVGYYEMPAPPPDENGFGSNVGLVHGFVESGGIYTKFDVPGATDTYPAAILGNTIVGSCATATGAHAFIYNNGVFTLFDHPQATYGTAPSGIFNGTIVGTYGADDGYHGFLLKDGVYTQLDDPLQAGANTNALGLWDDTVVGEYFGGQGNYGFIERGGVFTTFDISSANGPYTAISGIWGDTIVGSYLDEAGLSHGFVAAVPEPASVAVLGLALSLLFRAPRRVLQKIEHRRPMRLHPRGADAATATT